MIRITELALPLDYTPEALRAGRPQAPARSATPTCSISRCSSAATTRARRTPASSSSASSTSTVRDEAAVLKRFARDRPDRRRSRTRPITRLRKAPAHARGTPAGRRLRSRRAVRGAAARADGLQAHRARTRPRCATAHAGHLGAVAQEHPHARIQRAVRRGRRGPVLRRQALQPDQGSEILRPQGDARVRARRRAGGNPLRQQAAHRHLSPHGHRREDARGDHRARW